MTETQEEKIAKYYAIKPTQFTSLKELTISQNLGANGYMQQSLSLILAKKFERQSECMYLDFFVVKGLEIRQPESSHITLPAIEIMKGRDLPNVHSNYLVRDPEQSRILWFECGDFEFTVG